MLFVCLGGGALYQQAPLRTATGGGVGAAGVTDKAGEGKRTDGDPAPTSLELKPLTDSSATEDNVVDIPLHDAADGEPTPPRIRPGVSGLA